MKPAISVDLPAPVAPLTEANVPSVLKVAVALPTLVPSLRKLTFHWSEFVLLCDQSIVNVCVLPAAS